MNYFLVGEMFILFANRRQQAPKWLLLESLRWFNWINTENTRRDPGSAPKFRKIRTNVVFYVKAVSLNSLFSWQLSIPELDGNKKIQDFLFISDLQNKSAWNGMLRMPDSPTYRFTCPSNDELGKYWILSRNVFVPHYNTDTMKRCHYKFT